MFLLNYFFLYIIKYVKYLNHVCIFLCTRKQIFIYIFEKVNKLIFFKTHNYFQNIKINVMFLLNNLNLYAKHRSMFASHPL